MKILDFGSLNLDHFYSVDHIVEPGETQDTLAIETLSGGKGLNQAVAIAKAGLEVQLAGCIGEDGEMLRDVCRQYGVDDSLLKTVGGLTGNTVIQLDKNGQNSILLYGGANRAVDRAYVEEVLAHYGEGDYLVLQNEISELPYIIDSAYARGMKIVLNPSPFDDRLQACDMQKVAVFMVNEVEGAQLSGSEDPDRVLDAMEERYPDAHIVLTLGKRGSVYRYHGMTVPQSAFPVEAVDTTGAGDTFTGYFLAGFTAIEEEVTEEAIKKVMERASLASSITCTRKGAAPAIPTAAEVDAVTR